MDATNSTERMGQDRRRALGATVMGSVAAGATIASMVALFGGRAISAQDKYTVQVPNGLAFSDFRGYENWEDVAVSETETGIKVIVANPAMMGAFKDGLPANGKNFPDGSKIAKIEWTAKRNLESPYLVLVPDTLKSVSFIEKDTKRFPDTHGWAFAQFGYDAVSETFTPHGTGAECGYECHSRVAAQDYIFTAYPKR